ncbi:MAG: FHA domain-containing protein [Planctomycetales bacterium]|nr:FHA domain-containing protein [Planctomycetales bacterium]
MHFSLICDATGFVIKDLASTNGTFLNGRRIEQANVSNGDMIRAGFSVFEVRFDQKHSTK